MGKIKTNKNERRGLTDDILAIDSEVRQKNRKAKIASLSRQDEDDKFVGDKLSKKILQQARAQQEELQEEYPPSECTTKKEYLGSNNNAESSDENEGEDEDQFYENIHIDEDDEKAIKNFMSDTPAMQKTLADIIMEKINEKKTEIRSQLSEAPEKPVMDERIVSVFKSVGEILSKYRSGKLPKAFKIIPTLENWEEILYCTEPDNWTPAAMYQATRIFVSNFNSKMAQRFINLVLLPRVRDDIAEYKRLNYHLYMALKKSLFKPAAFFKGILLPLCESGNCTLREAVIVGSVLSKVSIPVLHSAAAILKIAEMQYTGANSIFLRILLDKKYALPFRVIDALVYHYLRFQSDKRELPVLWYQSFLTFSQRYKEDIASEQKEALIELCKKHSHQKITPEIRRELTQSKSRDKEIPEEAIGICINSMIFCQHLICRTTKALVISRYILHETKRFSSYYTFPLFTGTQQLLEVTHFYSHLPWWTTIALSTVLLRCITTVPMGINQNRMAAKMELLQPHLKEFADSVRIKTFKKGQNEGMDKIKMQSNFTKEVAKYTSEIYKKNEVSPIKFIMLPWVQLPTWITLSFALRNISGYVIGNGNVDTVYMPSEGITTEGLLWFQDLSVPDPYYIVPFIILFVNIANIEINAMRTHGLWKYVKPFLRFVAILTAVISSQVPSALSFYWCTSSVCGLIQNVVLKMPSVRRMLDIPKTNSEQQRSVANIFKVFKKRV